MYTSVYIYYNLYLYQRLSESVYRHTWPKSDCTKEGSKKSVAPAPAAAPALALAPAVGAGGGFAEVVEAGGGEGVGAVIAAAADVSVVVLAELSLPMLISRAI